MAYGVFAIGLVIGWAALFARAGWPWAVPIALLLAFAPLPFTCATGLALGAAAHQIFRLGLEARRG